MGKLEDGGREWKQKTTPLEKFYQMKLNLTIESDLIYLSE
jgi:hypothetical protein